jgi:hypothetical protein
MWLKNVVVYIITKIVNVFKRVLGKPEKDLSKDMLKLDLSRKLNIASLGTPLSAAKTVGPISVNMFNSDDIAKLVPLAESSEEYQQLITLEEEHKTAEFTITQRNEKVKSHGLLDMIRELRKKPENKTMVVSLDLSKDIFHLKELVQHFYDLFDNAYGSNNEKLFETEDLKAILEVIASTTKAAATGEVDMYSLDGRAVDIPRVSTERVRDNLTYTNENIRSLKDAYISTAGRIKDIARIISSKEMLMLSDYGVSYSALSGATLSQLQDVLKTVGPRRESALKLQKDMIKVQKKYEELINKMNPLIKSISAASNVSSVVYNSTYDRRIIELIQAAKMMSQVVSLRLVGLTLYIKELEDVQDTVTMLANLNGNMNISKVAKEMKLKVKGFDKFM